MSDVLTVPQGRFDLIRLPLRPHEPLRAFDAADEYLLNYLADAKAFRSGQRVLIVNDAFGALAVALHRFEPVALSDSLLSHDATRRNYRMNGLSVDAVRLLTSLETPAQVFDWIVIKAPKTLALLEYQLLTLRACMQADTRIVTAAMVKNLTHSVTALLTRIAGPTQASRAWKKARLLFTEPDGELPVPENPYPTVYRLPGKAYPIVNHANVFSRERLDIGTRFFLEHVGIFPDALDIIDLGCGNGLVGMAAAEKNPGATVHFIDESFMAVASAQQNFSEAFAGSRQAHFRVGDCLSDVAPASADVILCNPPFHQQNVVGDMMAATMFGQSRRVLRPGGQLWVIGNRHLGYHRLLKKWFDDVTLIASHPKFVILKALV